MPRCSCFLAPSLLVAFWILSAGSGRRVCVVGNLIFVLRIVPTRPLRLPQQQPQRGTGKNPHEHVLLPSSAGAGSFLFCLASSCEGRTKLPKPTPDEMGAIPSPLVDRVDVNADN